MIKLLITDFRKINNILSIATAIFNFNKILTFSLLLIIPTVYFYIWVYFSSVCFYLLFFLIKLCAISLLNLRFGLKLHLSLYKLPVNNLNLSVCSVLIFFTHYLAYAYSNLLVKIFCSGELFNFKFFGVLLYNFIFFYYFKIPRLLLHVLHEVVIALYLICCRHYDFKTVCAKHMVDKYVEISQLQNQ